MGVWGQERTWWPGRFPITLGSIPSTYLVSLTFIIHYPFRISGAVITPAQFENDWNPGLAELRDMPAFLANYEAVSGEIGGRRVSPFRLKPRPG